MDHIGDGFSAERAGASLGARSGTARPFESATETGSAERLESTMDKGPMVIVLMGVTGSGKTTVGTMLAKDMGWDFHDADDFHPAENVEKMRQGIPLNDEDRIPWLNALAEQIKHSHDTKKGIVLACSALKHAYRELLRKDKVPVQFVYLCGPHDLIKERLESRKGHYMNPALLPSQFAALEEPQDALYMDISPDPSEIVISIRKELML